MATASEGLWIQSAAAVGDILSDARRYDGVIRTEARDARILVGFSNGATVGSTLMLSSSGATLNGSMAASNVIVGGSNVLTELASLRGDVDSVRAGNLDNGAVRSSAIADSSVTSQKISGVLPTAVGGTGAGGGVFVGGRLAFGATAVGADRLDASDALRFNKTTTTLAVGEGPEGALTVAVTDVMAAISDLRSSLDNVSRGGLSDGAVTSNAIADSNVPAQKIKGVLPTAVGGTGTGASGTFVGGRLAFGAADGGAERLLTSAALSFNEGASTLAVGTGTGGALTVGGTDVMVAISGLSTSLESVRRGGLSNGAVASYAIADSNVPAHKISGVLPTAVGGTGTGASGTFVGGRLAFGAADGGAERLLTSAALRFDPTTQAVTLGADGAARCSMTVDANGELALTALSADGTPGASLSLREVRVLLRNIGVVPA